MEEKDCEAAKSIIEYDPGFDWNPPKLRVSRTAADHENDSQAVAYFNPLRVQILLQMFLKGIRKMLRGCAIEFRLPRFTYWQGYLIYDDTSDKLVVNHLEYKPLMLRAKY